MGCISQLCVSILLLCYTEPEVSSTSHTSSPVQLAVVVTVACVVLVVVAGPLVCVGVLLSRRCLSVSYTATEEPPGKVDAPAFSTFV